MATLAASQKKNARIDLRMTSAQKEEVELAASISGISMSQWVLENLLSCARETISRSNHTGLEPEDFDAFVAALDAPMNPKLEAFVSQKTIWEEQCASPCPEGWPTRIAWKGLPVGFRPLTGGFPSTREVRSSVAPPSYTSLLMSLAVLLAFTRSPPTRLTGGQSRAGLPTILPSKFQRFCLGCWV